MSDKSLIEWTDATANFVTGCERVSPGCDHCYAKMLIDRRQSKNPKSPRFGTKFEDVMLHPARLSLPASWKQPRKVFVNSLSDLFHADVPDEYIDKIFEQMLSVDRHVYQVLTKRPERMRRYVRRAFQDAPIPAHIWMGVSIESNAYAWRAAMLREVDAQTRFLSLEPLLGPVDQVSFKGIDWVIVGGESGKDARPMHPDWARDVRDRCVQHVVAFFFKQWGEFAPVHSLDGLVQLTLSGHRWVVHLDGTMTDKPGRSVFDRAGERGRVLMDRVGKKHAGRELDGRTWDQFPC